jgi:hypothetical protein
MFILDLFKSRRRLEVENLVLRQVIQTSSAVTTAGPTTLAALASGSWCDI